MVKTRHSGVIDAESPPAFISLANEKSRQSLKGDETGGVGEHPERTYGEERDEEYNIFEEKVVESRLRPRIGPSRAYNYIDVDSSEEEIIRQRHRHLPLQEYSQERRRSRYSRSQPVKEEMLEKEERPRRMLRRHSSPHDDTEEQTTEEEEDEDNRRGRVRRQRCSDDADESDRKNSRSRRHQLSVDEQEQGERVRRGLRKRQKREVEDEDEDNNGANNLRQRPTAEDDDEHLIRRSSRTRRQVYDTLNQSYLVSMPGRSRHDSGDQNDNSDTKEQDSDDNQEFSDMYSRVKRKRVQVKRNMYGVPVSDESDSEQDISKGNKNNNKDDDEEDDPGEGEDMKDEGNTSRRVTRQKNHSLDKKQPVVKSYSLREHKPRTDLYKAPVKEMRRKRIHASMFSGTPTKKNTNQAYCSPAQRRNVRKRSAFHSSTSSTSSDSESSDEKSFNRRKRKSMDKARSRMMPLNFNASAVPYPSIIKDRVKAGASLADIEPMYVDKNVTFNSIGGLGKHIRALKEMIVFPLLYDQVFQRFKVDPPRGVLFYGPPGTGKTLVARALANECSHGNKRVAFFMRKGADCLSKWVGESERQLRLLFDTAYRFRPSIIFFDEIDGLAPVRSSRQDQIHSSIVSTLLALMDGLDSRGEIVVIGATNHIDALDPALRRPGRFDREFLFNLPSLEARKQILKIHTAGWNPRLNDEFISELAEKCVGYCGADLKALCTETTMLALRRRYPQIYVTDEALQLDVSSINVTAKDFFNAVNNIIPTAQRAVNTPARALPGRVSALLQRQLDKVVNQLSDIFPPCLSQTASLDTAATSQVQALAENGIIWDELASDEEENAPSIYIQSTSNKGNKANRPSTELRAASSQSVPTYLNFASSVTSHPSTFRPRLILVGREGQGQTTYVAPAIIHKLENLPVHVLDLPALYAVTAKTPEESCANVFHEAKRKCPSIIYMPYINQWWDVMGDTLKAALLTLVHNLDPSLPLLLLATSEQPYQSLDHVLQSLFSQVSGEVIQMTDPNMEERRAYFQDLLLRQASRPPPQKKQAGKILEILKLDSIKKRNDNCARSQKVSISASNYKPHIIASDDKMKEIDNEPIRDCKVLLNRMSDKTGSAASCNSGAQLFDFLPSCLNDNPQSKAKRKQTDKAPKTKNTNLVSFRTNGNKKTASVRTKGNKKMASVRIGWNKRTPSVRTSGKEKSVSDRTNGNRKPVSDRTSGDKTPVSDGITLTSIRMTLRSHTANVKLNRNQSARRSYPCWKPIVHKSTRPAASKNDRSHKSHMCFLKVRPPSEIALLKWNKSTEVGQRLYSGSHQMLYKNQGFCSKNHSYSINEALALPLNLQNLRLNQNGPQTSNRHETLQKFLRSRTGSIKMHCCSHCSLWSRQLWIENSNTTSLHSQRILEVLPKATPPKPRELTEEELSLLVEKEELTLMELRIFLRDVLNKLGSDKKFSIFAKPVNIEDAVDYYDIIEHPMDLSTMMAKIDLHEYPTVLTFMQDIDLICSNALEYNPSRGPMDRIIRHKACALKDTAYAIIKTDLDKDFEKTCVEIEESRKRRGQKSTTVPNFYYTKSVGQSGSKSQTAANSYLDIPAPARSIPKPEGERFSRRVRGMNIDPVPPLEAVEKVFKQTRTGASSAPEESNNPENEHADPLQQNQPIPDEDKPNHVHNTNSSKSHLTPNTTLSKEKLVSVTDSKTGIDKKTVISSASLSSKRKKASKCVWCKPRRKRPKFTVTRTSTSHASGDEGAEDEISHEECDGEKPGHDDSKHDSHQLVVDTEVHEESKDLKSPGRISTRSRSPAHVSPGASCPTRVSTRRSSLSPNPVPITHRNSSTQPQVQVDQTECRKDTEKTIQGQSSHPESKGENIDKITVDPMETTCHQPDSFNQAPLVLKEPPDRPKVVKRLDLDSVTVDSGVGSSVDSNGDSRDSMDHRGEGEASLRTGSLFTKAEDFNQNCSRDMRNRASAILSEPTQKIVIDNNRLTSLLNRLVARTDGYTVERLEKIYSHLSQIIYRHRHEYDKGAMVSNLALKVDELTMIAPVTGTTTQNGTSSHSAV